MRWSRLWNLLRKFPHSLDKLDAIQHDIHLVEHRPGLDYPEGLAQKDRQAICLPAISGTLGPS